MLICRYCIPQKAGDPRRVDVFDNMNYFGWSPEYFFLFLIFNVVVRTAVRI
jgi:hypothetical protein